jgi:YHS domain-containing protein
MTSEAKKVLYCDSCKTPVKLPKKAAKSKDKQQPVEEEPIGFEATFHDGHGNEKDYHFCDETCLRTFLNERNSKSKASSLELDAVEGTSVVRVKIC